MKKRRMKKNRIIKGITLYMGFLFYLSAVLLAETQSKFALVVCLICVKWFAAVIQGTLLLEEEKEARKAVSEHVFHG